MNTNRAAARRDFCESLGFLLSLACMFLGPYAPALAEELATEAAESLTLRGWVDMTGGLPNPYLCGALSVGGAWSVESCGAGGGALNGSGAGDAGRSAQELTHFRLRRAFLAWQEGAQTLLFLPALGFAEVQRGQDQAGLKFQGDAAEAAGVEASVSVRWISKLASHALLRAQVDVGGAWVPSVGGVGEDMSPWVPFTMFDLGLDF